MMALLTFIWSWVLLWQQPTTAVSLDVDHLGSFYLVEKGSITKLQPSASRSASFQPTANNRLQFDPSNPLKPIVYDPHLLTITLLDNEMSSIGTLNLSSLGFIGVPAVCRAADEAIWIYDNIFHELKKVKLSGEVQLAGTNLLQQLRSAPQINFIRQHDQHVFLNDSVNGILVCDLYGNYDRLIPIRGLKKFTLYNDHIVYFRNNSVYLYNLQSLKTDSLELPDVETLTDAVTNGDQVMILSKNTLSLYRR